MYGASLALISLLLAQLACSPNRAETIDPEQRANAERRLAEAEKRALGLVWTYPEQPDKMTGGMIKWATINSVNQVQFRFPYEGPQRATLHLRIHPRHGRDVILTIDRGQFLCTSYDGCKVAVRFDEGKAESYSAASPADHSTTAIFIRGYPRFVSNLRRAKGLYIEAPFYQEGLQVFEFDVSGLVWEEKVKKTGEAPAVTPAETDLGRVRERLIDEAIDRVRKRQMAE